jgi:hypothetical protein
MADGQTSTQGRRTGGCLCGAVRFSAVPRLDTLGACHCGTCRRWSAGPFMCVECEGEVVFADTAALGVYRSSEWAERGFCTRCGTSLFYRLVDKPYYAVSAEAFDDRDGFVFTTQVFVDEKPGYYAFANRTKDMTGAEVFAAVAAAGQDDGGKA